jgi:hypothetical protein
VFPLPPPRFWPPDLLFSHMNMRILPS